MPYIFMQPVLVLGRVVTARALVPGLSFLYDPHSETRDDENGAENPSEEWNPHNKNADKQENPTGFGLTKHNYHVM